MRIALFQMTSGIDPTANAAAIVTAIEAAARDGATLLFTPEMSGLLDRKRDRAAPFIVSEEDDVVLRAVRDAARKHGIAVAIGSLAVREGGDSRLRNRAFMIDADGSVRARYDKMHLFDVDLADGTSWRESVAYGAGSVPVVVESPAGLIGLSICYDVRFPALYSALSGAGARILSIPAAFTVPTGSAHWHVLLRARAIENACFVVAAAQVGTHEDGRQTYGHSLVIDPWGRVILDMGGESSGVGFADIDLNEVDRARAAVPVLSHRRSVGEVLRA